MDRASELLERARSVYAACLRQYRDGLLEVGRLLHEFVLARVGTGGPRKRAVLEAAEGLGIDGDRVRRLIATAMVVEYLGGGLPLGAGIGHHAIYRFFVFVERPDVRGEVWRAKPAFREAATGLFKRAALEGWGQDMARKEAMRLFRGDGPRGAARRGPPPAMPQPPDFNPAVAPTGDLADYCLSLVERAGDPREAALMLMSRLQRVLGHRRTADEWLEEVAGV